MNKKILAAFAVTVLTLPAMAQSGALQLSPHWQEAIHQKVEASVFDNSIKTLKESLLLTIPVTKQFFGRNSFEADIPFTNTAQYRQLKNIRTYSSVAGCKAYALDEHWVIAGGTCLWNGRHTITFTDRSGSFATGLVELDKARKNLEIDGFAIPWKNNLFVQPHEQQAPHVILVRVPAASQLSRHLQQHLKINIWAFEKTIPELLQGGAFYINTARFGLNTVLKRQVIVDHSFDGIISLADHWGELSGVSTDPLAYIHNGKLHWIGVNRGVTNLRYGNLVGDWDGETSNDYFYFTKADADFIKNTISAHDPAAWARIQARRGLEIW